MQSYSFLYEQKTYSQLFFSCFILLFEIKQTVVMFPKMFPKKYFNVNAYIVGEAIRKARLAQSLTQKQKRLQAIGLQASKN